MRTHLLKKEAIGLGKYYKISNSYGNGQILIYKNDMVHASFFKKKLKNQQ